MQTEAEFAILIPHFNQSADLDQVVESCCAAKGCERAHLVIVDDGSATEHDVEYIVNKWRGFFKKVTLVKNQKNVGVSRSLNLGLACISEEFFFRIDADDRVLPKRFEAQLAILRDGYDLVFSEAEIVYEGELIARTYSPSLSVIRAALPFQCFLMHPTLAARTDFFRARDGYPEQARSAQDWAFWKLHLNSAKAIVLDEPLVKLGLRLDSVSNAKFKRAKGFQKTFRWRTALR